MSVTNSNAVGSSRELNNGSDEKEGLETGPTEFVGQGDASAVTDTSTRRAKGPAEKSGSLGVVEKALAALTALLVLLSTALGILVKKSSDTQDSLGGNITGLREQNSVLMEQVTDLTEQNSTLRERISVLSSTPSPTNTPSPGATVPDSPRTAELKMQLGDYGDLLSGIAGTAGVPSPRLQTKEWHPGKSILTGSALTL